MKAAGDGVTQADPFAVGTIFHPQFASGLTETSYQTDNLLSMVRVVPIDAGAESITLTRANEMLYVDLHWNPNKNAQSSDRIWRFGQKRDSICEILAADHPLDRRVTEVLNRKTRMIEATIDAASDDDDAPKDAVFEEEIRARQEAVAGERAVRREAESALEQEAVEMLRNGILERAKDVRLANSLLQQGDAIGLSDAQWRLVVKLAAQCEPATADPPVRSSASPPDREEINQQEGTS